MHKNMDFHIEQTRLNDTYRRLNSKNNFSSCTEQTQSQEPGYWSFFKLRIGFSILFLFFIVACSKSLHTNETKQIRSAFSKINKIDPYTKSVLKKLDLHMPLN